MLEEFEEKLTASPNEVFFSAVDADGAERSYTYREARYVAISFALQLEEHGVAAGGAVAVDLPNCPEYVFLVLAAAYGGFALVALNCRLSDQEKLQRLIGLERAQRFAGIYQVDEQRAKRMMDQVKAEISAHRAGALEQAREQNSFKLRNSLGLPQLTARIQKVVAQLGGDDTVPTEDQVELAEAECSADPFERTMHYARVFARRFDEDALALVMFTSGSTGASKAVPLTWRQLCASARATNAELGSDAETLWQLALPLYHVGGFQIVVRSVVGGTPFRLYGKFLPRLVLGDARLYGATHISVVDKMLQDLLEADKSGRLAQYRCILLGGGALNFATLVRAIDAGAVVQASYGMTETASNIARASVVPSFDGGLRLMEGYEARIVGEDAQGFGRLAVKGPSVTSGYLNAEAEFTDDGFFLTGDRAALAAGRLYIKERTTDMFVSGGENVYPAEIEDKLRRLPGVADAYVLGAPDEKWGRRPVAFVERAGSGESPAQAACSASGTMQVRTMLRDSLSPVYLPDRVFVLDALPRQGIGKIDRIAVETMYAQRLEIAKVNIYHIRMPFKKPFRTAHKILTDRNSLVIEVVDHEGRTGLGECVAFDTDWYLPETLADDLAVLRDELIPHLLGHVFLHPREVAAALAQCPHAASHPLACAALEPALWDLYGKLVHRPLWQLIDQEAGRLGIKGAGAKTVRISKLAQIEADAAEEEKPGRGSTVYQAAQRRFAAIDVPAGAVVGVGSIEDTLESVARCVDEGYGRVKIKIEPGSFGVVRAVRLKYPNLMLTLDANRSFREDDLGELRAFDALNVAWIEEPFAPQHSAVLEAQARKVARHAAAVDPDDAPRAAFERLARLQSYIATPICLDESFVNAHEAYLALEHDELRCFAVKIGKFGGVMGALEFVRAAQERDRIVWMGGMYDTSISKRLHAAFQTLDAVGFIGDIGAPTRYFHEDIGTPTYSIDRGCVRLNGEGSEDGLGCTLSDFGLGRTLMQRWTID